MKMESYKIDIAKNGEKGVKVISNNTKNANLQNLLLLKITVGLHLTQLAETALHAQNRKSFWLTWSSS